MKHIKTCSEYKTDKEASYFYNNKNTKDGKDGRCIECQQKRNKKLNAETNHITNAIHNPRNMYVNGKYVSRKHPFYKPGNYKTFQDAAFESLAKYAITPEGEVYIITNPAWKGWIKVGMAIDAEDRCKGYQTSSPLRDFKLKFKKYFDDRRTAEQTAHTLCAKKAEKRKGEWFKLDLKTAKDIINNMEVV